MCGILAFSCDAVVATESFLVSARFEGMVLGTVATISRFTRAVFSHMTKFEAFVSLQDGDMISKFARRPFNKYPFLILKSFSAFRLNFDDT